MSGFRITPVEAFVVLLCLGLLTILILPSLLISRDESRSLTCQSHQVKMVLSIRDPTEPITIHDPSVWPQLLAPRFGNPTLVEHCPSDDRRPPATASYGINPELREFKDIDGEKISFLDFNALVVNLSDEQRMTHWEKSVAPRHFDFVNVVFYDSHIESKKAVGIAPKDPDCLNTFWMPTNDFIP